MYTTIIDCNQLSDNLENENWVIVDTRYDLSDIEGGRKAYEKAHIPCAVFADVLNDLSGPPVTDHGRHPLPTATAMNQLFSSLGINQDTQVVVYDNGTGCFAARLWWMLQYMGHQACVVLDGGWSDWLAAGMNTEHGNRINKLGVFHGEPAQDWLILLDQVLSAPLLIDSRDPARYRGDNEPLDRVAGHIPGAYNRFWHDNLDETNHFKQPDDLKKEFSQIFSDISPENSVFYCGSGVTACHNLLAVAHAGLGHAKLYAGSWSEWCSDPERPITTGDNI